MVEDEDRVGRDVPSFFDGVDDYLELPNSADWAWGTSAFTVEFWVQKLNATGNEVIISSAVHAPWLSDKKFKTLIKNVNNIKGLINLIKEILADLTAANS